MPVHHGKFTAFQSQICANVNFQVGNPLTMALDVVWHQFLLFCYRNGLYFGHATDGLQLQSDPATSKMLNQSNSKLTLISTLEHALKRK